MIGGPYRIVFRYISKSDTLPFRKNRLLKFELLNRNFEKCTLGDIDRQEPNFLVRLTFNTRFDSKLDKESNGVFKISLALTVVEKMALFWREFKILTLYVGIHCT